MGQRPMESQRDRPACTRMSAVGTRFENHVRLAHVFKVMKRHTPPALKEQVPCHSRRVQHLPVRRINRELDEGLLNRMRQGLYRRTRVTLFGREELLLELSELDRWSIFNHRRASVLALVRIRDSSWNNYEFFAAITVLASFGDPLHVL